MTRDARSYFNYEFDEVDPNLRDSIRNNSAYPEEGFEGGRAPAESATSKGAKGAAEVAAKGGSGEDVAGSALMSSGNPYAMAAGLGLLTVSAAQRAKQKRADDEALEKNASYRRRQVAISDLISVARGMKL